MLGVARVAKVARVARGFGLSLASWLAGWLAEKSKAMN